MRKATAAEAYFVRDSFRRGYTDQSIAVQLQIKGWQRDDAQSFVLAMHGRPQTEPASGVLQPAGVQGAFGPNQVLGVIFIAVGALLAYSTWTGAIPHHGVYIPGTITILVGVARLFRA